MPILGGITVICMTLGSMLLRSAWHWFRQTLRYLSSSTQAKINFEAFWSEIYHNYAFLEGNTNWSLLHRLFGDKIDASTSEDDLWTALVDSIALLDDPCVTIHYEITGEDKIVANLEPWIAERLNTPHVLAKQITWGLLVCPSSSRPLGYMSVAAMTGFVELPLPFALSACGTRPPLKSQGMVPEIYDLEALRWAMQALIVHFQALSLHGLILDLRHNTGGGSFEFALTMASYFKGPSFAFIIEERLQKRQFHVPPLNINVRRFDGPLVVLQDRETAGTAELLLLALMQRPRTCRLGGRTAGRLSDVMERTLPNGWQVAIPYQRCYGEDGKQYQKVGIAPQKLCADDAAWWTAAIEYFKKENQLEGEHDNVVSACHA